MSVWLKNACWESQQAETAQGLTLCGLCRECRWVSLFGWAATCCDCPQLDSKYHLSVQWLFLVWNKVSHLSVHELIFWWINWVWIGKALNWIQLLVPPVTNLFCLGSVDRGPQQPPLQVSQFSFLKAEERSDSFPLISHQGKCFFMKRKKETYAIAL